MAKMTDDTLLKHLQSNEDDAAQYVEAIGAYRLASMREYYRSRIPATKPLMDGLRSSRLRCRTRWNGYFPNCWTCSPPAMRRWF